MRVLVAHGDRPTRAALQDLLVSAGADVGGVAGAATAFTRARRDKPHVVVLDAALCRRDRRDLLREITADPELLGTAVILVEEAAGLEEVGAALEQGAFMVWDSARPVPTMIAGVRAAARLRELLDFALRQHTTLEDLAYRDELTGLANRRGTVRRLEVLLSRARRHRQDLAVLLLDADHFKHVNDTYGHAVGDDVLRALGALVSARVRAEDVVGRWGGEEFVVALPDTESSGAAALAEQLREAVAATPLDAGGVRVPLTLSVGVAEWAGGGVEELVDRADRALYAAKASGRDRVEVAAPAGRFVR